MKKYLLSLLLIISALFTNATPPEQYDYMFSAIKEMTVTSGNAYAEYWWTNANNATVSKSINFATTGSYRIDLSAYKVSGTTRLQVLIDGVVKGTDTIVNSNVQIYSVFIPSITAGTHTLSLKNSNLGTSPYNHCRVGLVYVTKSTLQVPAPLPVITPLPMPGANSYLQGDHYRSKILRGYNLSIIYTLGDLTAKNIPMATATGANLGRYWITISHPTGSASYYYSNTSGTNLGTTPLTTFDSALRVGRKNGMRLILTFQVMPEQGECDLWGTSADAIARRNGVKAKWVEVATRYKDSVWVGAYDLINEPRLNNNVAEYLRWQQEVIEAIRAVDPNHVIAVECLKNEMYANMLPFPYDNIIYTPHNYSPLSITHQGINAYTGSTSSQSRRVYPDANWNYTNAYNTLQDVRTFSQRFRVPIWIGELSCVNWAPWNPAVNQWTSTKWLDDDIGILEAEGWSWTYHSWREFQAWDAEIPSQWYVDKGFTYVNAAPFTSATRSQVASDWTAQRDTNSPSMQVLKKYFRLPPPAQPPPVIVYPSAPEHIIVVWFGNRTYSGIVGNTTDAPYLNSLISQGSLFTNTYAVTRPSYPNYTAFFAGSTFTITSDACINNKPYSTQSIWSALRGSSKTFAWYSESMPSRGFTGCDAYPYVERHNPTTIFTNVTDTINKPFSMFNWSDTSAGNMALLETVVAITPNQLNNMYDGTIKTADSWLQSKLGKLIAWTKNHNSIVFIMHDQTDPNSVDNHIPVIAVGERIKVNYQNTGVYDHYNFTKTILAYWSASRSFGQLGTKTVITDLYK